MPQPIDVSTPTDCEIIVKREFAAPRSALWDWHTRPELVQRWLYGPEGWSLAVCEIDLRAGGRYRYVWRSLATGREFGAGGEYREIDAPGRLATTEKMDDFGSPSLNTLTLEEYECRTRLAVSMRFATAEIRDDALRNGMTNGMAVSYDRLEAQLLQAG